MFSEQRRKPKISFQSEVTHNVKLVSFQADLLTLPRKVTKKEKNGQHAIKYILIVIDIVSKLVFGASMNRKFSSDVIAAFDAILHKIRKQQRNHPTAVFNKFIFMATDYGKCFSVSALY